MKALIIGSGGREHAIAWKLSQDARIKKIYIAPGNAGTAQLERAENLALNTIDELLNFAKTENIALSFVGAEALLVEGIVDRFQQAGLSIFGPHQKAAMLEGSKRYAKTFMEKYGVKTAAYKSFNNSQDALNHLKTTPYPTVIKASGLAAGKGVIICQNQEEAQKAVHSIMEDKRFGDAGEEIVIEEYLQGFEISILSITDGKTIIPLKSAKDHKTIGENNTGENTGGMGVVAPHPNYTPEIEQAFYQDILEPTLKGLQNEKLEFSGVIFFGLMVNEKGVYLLEYNMRLGDPETQAVLPLLNTPLLDIINASLDKKLKNLELKWSEQQAVCVVAASGGYPQKFKTSLPITGIGKASFYAQIFIAGATEKDKQTLTSGGRVLNAVGLGENLQEARQKAYQALQEIHFENMVYRRDIGA